MRSAAYHLRLRRRGVGDLLGATFSHPSALPFALISALGVLWGTSYALVAFAIPTIPPMTLTALRVSMASLVLVLFARARGHRLPRDDTTRWRLFVLGAINPALAWTLIAWGQKYVSGTLAGVINTLSPVFAILLIALWRHSERISRRRLVGVTLGFIGVIAILGPTVATNANDAFVAKCAILGGTLGFAVSALFARRIDNLPPSVAAAGVLLSAGLILTPLACVVEQPWTVSPSPAALAATVILTLFCTALAFLIYFRLLQTIGAAGTLTVGYIRIGVAVLLGVSLHGDIVTVPLLVGLVCIVAGVVLATRDAAHGHNCARS